MVTLIKIYFHAIYNQNHKTEQNISHQRHLDRTRTSSFRYFIVQLPTNYCILSLWSLAPIKTITFPLLYQTRIALNVQYDLIAPDILGQLKSCLLPRSPRQSRASNSLYSQCRPPHRDLTASCWCSLTLELLIRFCMDCSIFQFLQKGHGYPAGHSIAGLFWQTSLQIRLR